MSPQRSVSSENLTNPGDSISYSHSAQSRAGRAVIKLLENAQDIASIVNLYRDEGYDFADLMIRQAAQRTENRILKTFDQKLARLDGVELLGTTH